MISIFRKAQSKTGPIHLEMWQILERIKNGNSKKAIEKVRATEGRAKAAAKLGLPSICFSGKFDTRKDEEIQQHSGFICLDFDHLGDDLDSMKEAISDIPFTYSVFISPSGDGLKALIRVPASIELHREHYRAAMKFYAEATHNVYKPDTKCLNESRICFESFDPDIFINTEGSVFSEQLTEKAYQHWLKPPAQGQVLTAPVALSKRNWADHVKQVTANIISAATDGEKHAKLIHASKLMGGYIGAGHIDEQSARTHLQTCIENKAGVTNIKHAHKTIEDGIAYGRLHPVELNSDYNLDAEGFQPYDKIDKEIYAEAMAHLKDGNAVEDIGMHMDNLAKRLQKNIEHVESIFKSVYEKNKDMFGWNNWLEIKRIEYFLNTKYDFIKNEITLQTDCRPKKGDKWDDMNEDSIYRLLQHNNFKFALDKLRSLLRSDFVESYHPIKDYFTTLPLWDGVTDHISKLASYIQTTDQEFFIEQLKKTLIRCIACSTTGYVNRIVFTLVGEAQETGKSSFIRFLNPFGEKLYSEAPMKDGKDTEISFAENFIYNMEELAALKAYDVDKLKAVISRGTIKERESYGKRAQARQRICNFFASTNNKEFLTDSENTRWMVFDIVSIDHDYSNYETGKKEVDIHAVWAQAYTLYKGGYNFHMTTDERSKRDHKNKDYEVRTPEREIIMQYMEICKANEPLSGFMCNADIQIMISAAAAGGLKVNPKAVGQAMRSLKFLPAVKNINGHTMRGYHVFLKKVTDPLIYKDITVTESSGVFKVSHTPDQGKMFNE